MVKPNQSTGAEPKTKKKGFSLLSKTKTSGVSRNLIPFTRRKVAKPAADKTSTAIQPPIHSVSFASGGGEQKDRKKRSTTEDSGNSNNNGNISDASKVSSLTDRDGLNASAETRRLEAKSRVADTVAKVDAEGSHNNSREASLSSTDRSSEFSYSKVGEAKIVRPMSPKAGTRLFVKETERPQPGSDEEVHKSDRSKEKADPANESSASARLLSPSSDGSSHSSSSSSSSSTGSIDDENKESPTGSENASGERLQHEATTRAETASEEGPSNTIAFEKVKALLHRVNPTLPLAVDTRPQAGSPTNVHTPRMNNTSTSNDEDVHRVQRDPTPSVGKIANQISDPGRPLSPAVVGRQMYDPPTSPIEERHAVDAPSGAIIHSESSNKSPWARHLERIAPPQQHKSFLHKSGSSIPPLSPQRQQDSPLVRSIKKREEQAISAVPSPVLPIQGVSQEKLEVVQEGSTDEKHFLDEDDKERGITPTGGSPKEAMGDLKGKESSNKESWSYWFGLPPTYGATETAGEDQKSPHALPKTKEPAVEDKIRTPKEGSMRDRVMKTSLVTRAPATPPSAKTNPFDDQSVDSALNALDIVVPQHVTDSFKPQLRQSTNPFSPQNIVNDSAANSARMAPTGTNPFESSDKKEPTIEKTQTEDSLAVLKKLALMMTSPLDPSITEEPPIKASVTSPIIAELDPKSSVPSNTTNPFEEPSKAGTPYRASANPFEDSNSDPKNTGRRLTDTNPFDDSRADTEPKTKSKGATNQSIGGDESSDDEIPVPPLTGHSPSTKPAKSPRHKVKGRKKWATPAPLSETNAIQTSVNQKAAAMAEKHVANTKKLSSEEARAIARQAIERSKQKNPAQQKRAGRGAKHSQGKPSSSQERETKDDPVSDFPLQHIIGSPHSETISGLGQSRDDFKDFLSVNESMHENIEGIDRYAHHNTSSSLKGASSFESEVVKDRDRYAPINEAPTPQDAQESEEKPVASADEAVPKKKEVLLDEISEWTTDSPETGGKAIEIILKDDSSQAIDPMDRELDLVLADDLTVDEDVSCRGLDNKAESTSVSGVGFELTVSEHLQALAHRINISSNQKPLDTIEEPSAKKTIGSMELPSKNPFASDAILNLRSHETVDVNNDTAEAEDNVPHQQKASSPSRDPSPTGIGQGAQSETTKTHGDRYTPKTVGKDVSPSLARHGFSSTPRRKKLQRESVLARQNKLWKQSSVDSSFDDGRDLCREPSGLEVITTASVAAAPTVNAQQDPVGRSPLDLQQSRPDPEDFPDTQRADTESTQSLVMQKSHAVKTEELVLSLRADGMKPSKVKQILAFGQKAASLSPKSKSALENRMERLNPDSKKILKKSIILAKDKKKKKKRSSVPELIDLTSIHTLDDLDVDDAVWLFDLSPKEESKKGQKGDDDLDSMMDLAAKRLEEGASQFFPADQQLDEEPTTLENVIEFASKVLVGQDDKVAGSKEKSSIPFVPSLSSREKDDSIAAVPAGPNEVGEKTADVVVVVQGKDVSPMPVPVLDIPQVSDIHPYPANDMMMGNPYLSFPVGMVEGTNPWIYHQKAGHQPFHAMPVSRPAPTPETTGARGARGSRGNEEEPIFYSRRIGKDMVDGDMEKDFCDVLDEVFQSFDVTEHVKTLKAHSQSFSEALGAISPAQSSSPDDQKDANVSHRRPMPAKGRRRQTNSAGHLLSHEARVQNETQQEEQGMFDYVSDEILRPGILALQLALSGEEEHQHRPSPPFNVGSTGIDNENRLTRQKPTPEGNNMMRSRHALHESAQKPVLLRRTYSVGEDPVRSLESVESGPTFSVGEDPLGSRDRLASDSQSLKSEDVRQDPVGVRSASTQSAVVIGASPLPGVALTDGVDNKTCESTPVIKSTTPPKPDPAESKASSKASQRCKQGSGTPSIPPKVETPKESSSSRKPMLRGQKPCTPREAVTAPTSSNATSRPKLELSTQEKIPQPDRIETPKETPKQTPKESRRATAEMPHPDQDKGSPHLVAPKAGDEEESGVVVESFQSNERPPLSTQRSTVEIIIEESRPSSVPPKASTSTSYMIVKHDLLDTFFERAENIICGAGPNHTDRGGGMGYASDSVEGIVSPQEDANDLADKIPEQKNQVASHEKKDLLDQYGEAVERHVCSSGRTPQDNDNTTEQQTVMFICGPSVQRQSPASPPVNNAEQKDLLDRYGEAVERTICSGPEEMKTDSDVAEKNPALVAMQKGLIERYGQAIEQQATSGGDGNLPAIDKVPSDDSGLAQETTTLDEELNKGENKEAASSKIIEDQANAAGEPCPGRNAGEKSALSSSLQPKHEEVINAKTVSPAAVPLDADTVPASEPEERKRTEPQKVAIVSKAHSRGVDQVVEGDIARVEQVGCELTQKMRTSSKPPLPAQSNVAAEKVVQQETKDCAAVNIPERPFLASKCMKTAPVPEQPLIRNKALADMSDSASNVGLPLVASEESKEGAAANAPGGSNPPTLPTRLGRPSQKVLDESEIALAATCSDVALVLQVDETTGEPYLAPVEAVSSTIGLQKDESHDVNDVPPQETSESVDRFENGFHSVGSTGPGRDSSRLRSMSSGQEEMMSSLVDPGPNEVADRVGAHAGPSDEGVALNMDKTNKSKAATDEIEIDNQNMADPNIDSCRCSGCSRSFSSMDHLLRHCEDSGHTPGRPSTESEKDAVANDIPQKESSARKTSTERNGNTISEPFMTTSIGTQTASDRGTQTGLQQAESVTRQVKGNGGTRDSVTQRNVATTASPGEFLPQSTMKESIDPVPNQETEMNEDSDFEFDDAEKVVNEVLAMNKVVNEMLAMKSFSPRAAKVMKSQFGFGFTEDDVKDESKADSLMTSEGTSKTGSEMPREFVTATEQANEPTHEELLAAADDDAEISQSVSESKTEARPSQQSPEGSSYEEMHLLGSKTRSGSESETESRLLTRLFSRTRSPESVSESKMSQPGVKSIPTTEKPLNTDVAFTAPVIHVNSGSESDVIEMNIIAEGKGRSTETQLRSNSSGQTEESNKTDALIKPIDKTTSDSTNRGARNSMDQQRLFRKAKSEDVTKVDVVREIREVHTSFALSSTSKASTKGKKKPHSDSAETTTSQGQDSGTALEESEPHVAEASALSSLSFTAPSVNASANGLNAGIVEGTGTGQTTARADPPSGRATPSLPFVRGMDPPSIAEMPTIDSAMISTVLSILTAEKDKYETEHTLEGVEVTVDSSPRRRSEDGKDQQTEAVSQTVAKGSNPFSEALGSLKSSIGAAAKLSGDESNLHLASTNGKSIDNSSLLLASAAAGLSKALEPHESPIDNANDNGTISSIDDSHDETGASVQENSRKAMESSGNSVTGNSHDSSTLAANSKKGSSIMHHRISSYTGTGPFCFAGLRQIFHQGPPVQKASIAIEEAERSDESSGSISTSGLVLVNRSRKGTPAEMDLEVVQVQPQEPVLDEATSTNQVRGTSISKSKSSRSSTRKSKARIPKEIDVGKQSNGREHKEDEDEERAVGSSQPSVKTPTSLSSVSSPPNRLESSSGSRVSGSRVSGERKISRFGSDTGETAISGPPSRSTASVSRSCAQSLGPISESSPSEAKLSPSTKAPSFNRSKDDDSGLLLALTRSEAEPTLALLSTSGTSGSSQAESSQTENDKLHIDPALWGSIAMSDQDSTGSSPHKAFLASRENSSKEFYKGASVSETDVDGPSLTRSSHMSNFKRSEILSRVEQVRAMAASPRAGGGRSGGSDNSYSHQSSAGSTASQSHQSSNGSGGSTGGSTESASGPTISSRSFVRSARLQTVLNRLRKRQPLKTNDSQSVSSSEVDNVDVDELFSRYDNIVKHMVVADKDRLERVKERQLSENKKDQIIDVTALGSCASHDTSRAEDSSPIRSRGGDSTHVERQMTLQRRTNSFGSASEQSATPSEKARELRRQLDQALRTSVAIRSTQERLNSEISSFKTRLQQQRSAVPGADSSGMSDTRGNNDSTVMRHLSGDRSPQRTSHFSTEPSASRFGSSSYAPASYGTTAASWNAENCIVIDDAVPTFQQQTQLQHHMHQQQQQRTLTGNQQQNSQSMIRSTIDNVQEQDESSASSTDDEETIRLRQLDSIIHGLRSAQERKRHEDQV